MPHKDGTDRKEYQADWYVKNRTAVIKRTGTYSKDNYKAGVFSTGRGGDNGYASELIVRTDLLLRGLDVTVPENRCCPDDVHFKAGDDRWVSIQVKTAVVNKKTGHWQYRLHRKKLVSSDIIAWVNLHDRTIRYMDNVKKVPKELL